jgi:serine/threonine-protein kinase
MRRDEAERLYDQARALPPEARTPFLEDACREDVELRSELASLLGNAEGAEEFFQRLAGVVGSPSLDIAEPSPGSMVSHYRVVGWIGSGGMGAVYRAHDTRLKRDVALKFLPPHPNTSLDAEERLLLEARAAAGLEHPNICSVHEIGETAEGRPFIAMAFYEGETLKERLRRGPLPAAESVGVAAQIARGLAAAHARGIVHRDVKPGNVMLTPDGSVKLLDFGLAKVTDVSLTRPGVTPGTLAYMSPEQARGDPVDHRTDLWSLGVVLYEMLTGVHPFRGGNDRAVIDAILHGKPESLRRRAPAAPRSLERIVKHLLRKERDARYGSAAEALTDLAKAMETAPTPSRRRWLARIALGLLVLGVIGAVGAAVRSFRPAPAVSASPAVIAVLPFSYQGSPRFEYLTEGMVDLLSARIDGAAGLRSVDPRALLGFMDRDRSTVDPQRGRLVAERFRAGRFVIGSIVEAGGRLQVSATIYDDEARPQSSVAATAESEAGILDAADRVARHILLGTQDTVFDVRVADRATSSLPALKAYLEGLRALRAGRMEAARDAIQHATELDTSFALAFYWLGSITGDRETVDRALRHSNRLAEHQRWLVEALAAILRGDHMIANQRIRQALTVRPELAEAWVRLGELTLYGGGLLGGPWVDAREALERALALEPQDDRDLFGILFGLAAIAAREGRRAEFDSLTGRLLQLNPSPWLASNLRGQHAVVMGDTAELARFMADLRTRPDPWAQSSAGAVTWFTGDLSAGRRLWGLITEPSRSRGFRVTAHVTLAKIELTSGRRRAADAELEAVRALDAGSALEHRAYFALTRFQEASRSELAALRDSLERWDAAAAMRSDGDALLAAHRRAHPYLKLYLLGLLSARLGDEAAALRYAGQLERADRSSLPGAFAADGGQFVRAEVAWTRGRPQEALATLENARFWRTWPAFEVENSDDSPFYGHMHERFARAELLYELGREEEAIPWYRVFAYDLLYTAPAHLRLAQIYERRGERPKAIEHFSRFVELWKDCDPALQPMVQQARDALTRLR